MARLSVIDSRHRLAVEPSSPPGTKRRPDHPERRSSTRPAISSHSARSRTPMSFLAIACWRFCPGAGPGGEDRPHGPTGRAPHSPRTVQGRTEPVDLGAGDARPGVDDRRGCTDLPPLRLPATRPKSSQPDPLPTRLAPPKLPSHFLKKTILCIGLFSLQIALHWIYTGLAHGAGLVVSPEPPPRLGTAHHGIAEIPEAYGGGPCPSSGSHIPVSTTSAS
jgi:hypothetical protein